MSFKIKALHLVLALALHGCAIRSANVGNPTAQLLADEAVETAAGDVMLPGLRLEDVAVPADLQATLEALEVACPEFSEHLLWVECGEAPCLIHVWGAQKPVPGQTAWQTATCGLGSPDVIQADYTAFGTFEAMLGRAVYAVDAPAGYDADPVRRREATLTLHDTVVALAEETYGPPSPEVREGYATMRAWLATDGVRQEARDPE